MSIPHRPNGDAFNDDHDLHLDARTDVPRDGADALDTWLNEIARNDGSPNTRSGSGHHRPDVRINDQDDAESLTATAAAFHHRIEAAYSREFRAARPDPHLWEKIMTDTTTSPTTTSPSASSAPWRGATQKNDGPTVSSRPTRHRSPTPAMRRQQLWNMVANVGLVLAILAAGFGVWFYSGEPGLPRGSGDDPNVPGVAMQPSTPDSTPSATEESEVSVPPVATPQPATDCDFSSDIPRFKGVESSPVDGTALLLTPDGELVLTCPEEATPTTLATGVESFMPMDWPGIASISYDNAPNPEDRERAVVNIMTGDVLKVGTRPSGYHDLNQHPGSPWLVAPNYDDPGDWVIVDLRTMESKLLSSYEPNQVNGQAARFVHDVTTTANGNDDTLVIANQFSNTYGGGIINPSDSAFHEIAMAPGGAYAQYGPLMNNDIPGSLLVLDGSLDHARWMSLPHEDQTYVDVLLSPDGEYLALTSVEADFFQERVRSEAGEIQGDILFSVMRLPDGAEVAQSEPTGPHHSSEMVWVQDGTGLAYLDDGAVKMLPTDPNTEPFTLYDGIGRLQSLRPTTDSSTLLADETQADNRRVLSINTETGETTELSGHVTHDYLAMYHLLPETRFLVLVQPEDSESQNTTYHLADAVTGDVLEEIAIPIDVGGMGKGAVASTHDGNTAVVAFNAQHVYAMRTADNEPQVNKLPMPEGIENPTAMVGALLSPDGSKLFIGQVNNESSTYWMMSLTDETETWTSLSGYPAFVPGTGE